MQKRSEGKKERQGKSGETMTPPRALGFIHAFKHLTFRHPLVIKACVPWPHLYNN